MTISGYRVWLEAQGFTRSTIRQRMSFAAARERAWGSDFDVEPHQVAEWLNRYSGWTRRTYYNHLVSLFTWLSERDAEERNPLERYKRPRRPRPKANPLSGDELERVFSSATGDLLAWLMLAYLAGLRRFEIAKFRGEDINATRINVVGKGGDEWDLPTHPQLWELAEQYPRRGHWFPSRFRSNVHASETTVGIAIANHFRSVGVDEGATHRLRHSYATNLDRSGVRTRVVQELLRHRHLDTTQSYLAVLDAELHAGVRLLNVNPSQAGPSRPSSGHWASPAAETSALAA